MWRVQDASTHHVVSTGFEHEALSDPVVLTEEVLPLFAHVRPLEDGSALGHYTYRVAAGVGVDAFECVDHGWKFISPHPPRVTPLEGGAPNLLQIGLFQSYRLLMVFAERTVSSELQKSEVRVQPGPLVVQVGGVRTVPPILHSGGETMVNRICVYVVHDFAEIHIGIDIFGLHVLHEQASHSTVFSVETLRIAIEGVGEGF
jgi:hypothetical protein